MDAGWQAVQNWAIFGVAVSGLAYYYYPREKTAHKIAPPLKELKKEAKKTQRKVEQKIAEDVPKQVQNGGKKRKPKVESAPQTHAPTVSEDNDRDDIDMSTRQFAANMQKAREGIQVKSASNKEVRVKTVKPKDSQANMPILSSGSSQADAEEDWSPDEFSGAKAGGIDDMLEPAAPGPSSLRITATQEKPAKEKMNKGTKKEVVENKKQRQNRKKVEEKKLAREADEQERKAREEKQRRTARESRGEPAKNGIPIAPAPATNAWAQQNAARGAHAPAADNAGNNVQLLDTLDTESNSSSNQGASTAATSVVADAAPSRWREDDEFVKALEESERESGWSEVKTSKKPKKKTQAESTGDITPVPAPVANVKAAPKVNKKPNSSKPLGFQALADEAEQTVSLDSNDPSSWVA